MNTSSKATGSPLANFLPGQEEKNGSFAAIVYDGLLLVVLTIMMKK